MNLKINNKEENNSILTFTLSGVNVSLANSIRRVILSEIPLVVFKTTPYEENKAIIHINTSQLNNEIIKQRLSCIPININLLNYEDFPFQNYLLEINVDNITDHIIYITTEDFKIIDTTTGKLISKEKTREIFPVNEYTNNYIDFLRLKPTLSEELPGEKLHLTCKFSIESAKNNCMFNAVSNCSYSFTLDDEKIEDELGKKQQQLKDNGKDKDEIEFEIKNWKLLDALRIYKKDSFDFSIQTACAYSNIELLIKACDILILKLDDLNKIINDDKLEINNSQNTMSNCFDIILKNEDYTLGKILEYMLYEKFYEGTQIFTYCGFKKVHPHDNDSIIRIAYKDAVEKSTIKTNINECIIDLTDIYIKIINIFKKK
jgi:DNA-directed RNA polymerase alpha subunit